MAEPLLSAFRQVGLRAPTRVTRLLSSRSCLPAVAQGVHLSTPSLASRFASTRSLTTRRSPALSNTFSVGFGSVARPTYGSPRSALITMCRGMASSTSCQSSASASASTTASGSSSEVPPEEPITLTRPAVAKQMFFLALLVYGIVIVGGLTRLTESGLSIVEWNPVMGIKLPMTQAAWEEEWEKYKQSPEFYILNRNMTIEDFKSIFMWEWAHRILGRVIGVAFIVPAAFFLAKPGWVGPGYRWKLYAIAAGIAFQGALGWFMVSSGLVPPKGSLVAERIAQEQAGIKPTDTVSTDWHPRVSQFRLTAHLAAAFALYAGMLYTGLNVMRDWKLAHRVGNVGGWDIAPEGISMEFGQPAGETAVRLYARALNSPLLRRYTRTVAAVATLLCVTIVSGAMVAGLDAGLVYNEFPTMGGWRLAPPIKELFDPRYVTRYQQRGPDGTFPEVTTGQLIWANLTQNPVTVQLVHRALATVTFGCVWALFLKTKKLVRTLPKLTANAPGGPVYVPPKILTLAKASVHAATTQVILGIATLIYMVPISLASAHQAIALAVFSILIALLANLRRPTQAVMMWRQLKLAQQAMRTHKPTPVKA